MEQSVLKVENLGRSFGTKIVFSGVSFQFGSGDIVILEGTNGAGKTTLLRTLATLISPSEGTAWINGLDIRENQKKIRPLLGWLAASDSGFVPRFTGRQNLLFFASLNEILPKNLDELIAKFINWKPFRGALDTPYYLCSAGMKQSLSFAKSMMSNPTLLLLDEPTRSLDDESIDQMARIIEGFVRQSENPKAVIFSAPAKTALDKIANRKLRIGEGKVKP